MKSGRVYLAGITLPPNYWRRRSGGYPNIGQRTTRLVTPPAAAPSDGALPIIPCTRRIARRHHTPADHQMFAQARAAVAPLVGKRLVMDL